VAGDFQPEMEEPEAHPRSSGMPPYRSAIRVLMLALLSAVRCYGAPVTTVDALVAAVRDGAEGARIEIAAGTYALTGPLEPKTGMTLKGAGMSKTILTAAEDWKPALASLPDPEMKTDGMDTRAYLIRLQDQAAKVTVSGMTLRAPRLHGALFGYGNHDLHLHHLRVQDVLWSGIRTFAMQRARIHDCEFIDAGGRWEKGAPGEKGGITGGAIFAIWMEDSEISHNRFTRTQKGPADEFYGIKVRQAKRCRVHHNTIEVNFSMEFPFENDEDVEISHNICHGTISIPKHAGGPVPASGRTFHIHHNWMKDSYSIEFVRNGVEISHNLFDFVPAKDHGNTISGFGQAAAAGPALFHNNLVNNPGRGVIWINEPYANLVVRNNHIIARRTATPRTEGLFGFSAACDFKTFRFEDNIIECRDLERPMFRNDESGKSVVVNNRLSGISDTARYENRRTSSVPGPEKPLKFACGVHGEVRVDGWEARAVKR
jgi:nitrous oxidase accessory protein